MKSLHLGLGVIAVASFISGASMFAGEWTKASDRSKEPLSGLMLAKLASTQRVVSGLVSKDFAEIKRGAEEMQSICDATQWEMHPDPVFGHHRTELRKQSVKLARMADSQNLDGAAFIYMQTMSTCMSCHEHCRDILRIAEISKQDNSVIPIPTSEEELRWSNRGGLRR